MSSACTSCEWASEDVAIPGLDAMDEDQAYRAMDLLVDADVEGAVQKAVFFAAADLLNLEVDPLLFDTTSTYFERDAEEPDGGLRRDGHSEDSRPDLPQIVIGLAVTKEGIPVRVWTWPGNASDAAVLPQVKDDLRGWRLGRVVTVVDRGFSSEENLEYLRHAGGHWIAGERMRDGNAEHDAALSRQGRYQAVRDNLRVKEVRLDEHGQRRFIVCHNPAEAGRDRARREETIARLEAELARIDTARNRLAKAKPGARRDRKAAAHSKAECALRDHPTLGRSLRQLKSGRLRIDRAKVKAEARLDGKFLLSTSDPDLSAADVSLGYKNLLEAERGFRDLKSTLELRPVFHRLPHRICAHVLLCWLAPLLIRVAERSTRQTWRRIATDLGRVHEVTVAFDASTVTARAPSATPRPACSAPATSPRHRGSPTSTPPEPPHHGVGTRPGRGASAFPQVNPRFSAPACPQAAELGTKDAQYADEAARLEPAGVTIVLDLPDSFYQSTVQDLKPWSAPPPRLRKPEPADADGKELTITALSSQDGPRVTARDSAIAD